MEDKSARPNNRSTGDFGEEMALAHLQGLGMKLVERNFRCKLGEIDLIMQDNNVLVFAEVKLRKNPFLGPAALAVTPSKQRTIIRVAQYYLMQKKLRNPFMRFDVVGIENMGDSWKCVYYRNAFLSSR